MSFSLARAWGLVIICTQEVEGLLMSLSLQGPSEVYMFMLCRSSWSQTCSHMEIKTTAASHFLPTGIILWETAWVSGPHAGPLGFGSWSRIRRRSHDGDTALMFSGRACEWRCRPTKPCYITARLSVASRFCLHFHPPTRTPLYRSLPTQQRPSGI